MLLTPHPHQLTGAAFLADRKFALLADDCRVGKTGAAIMACDLVCAGSVLIVTTASGRGVWRKAFAEWSAAPRKIVIVGWSEISKPKVFRDLRQRRWSRFILDESHYAKNHETARTCSVYGPLATEFEAGLVASADGGWCLSATPIPNAPNDLWPMLRRLAPERLTTLFGPTDVSSYAAFVDRYCIVRKKRLTRWKSIDVVVAGKNEAELAARLDDFMLRRTQQDIGITEPVYDTLPLIVAEHVRKKLEADIDADAVMRAARRGDEAELEKHLGPARRLTGNVKAKAVADFVRDEFECGLDKVVLMYWHRDVGDLLAKELARFGVAKLDGETTARGRQRAQELFDDDGCRVFLGQIQAAGEAIDLSASAELIFVEASFVPAAMKQAALRITNMSQQRQPRVRVAVLENSIDERVQGVLLRKWSSIRKVMS